MPPDEVQAIVDEARTALCGENGYQAAQRIRQLPDGGDLLLIALSGYGQPEELACSQQAVTSSSH